MTMRSNYTVIDLDLTVAREDEPHDVGARTLIVTDIDGDVMVRLNSPNAAQIRIGGTGKISTGEFIDRIYVTNPKGSGVVQFIASDNVCADFRGAAQESGDESEIVFHAVPYSPNAATPALTMREISTALPGSAETGGAQGNGGVAISGYRAEWGQMVLHAADPDAAVTNRYAAGWLMHPPLPLEWMQTNTRDLSTHIGKVWAVRMSAAARLVGVTARSFLGIGRGSNLGNVGQFIGAGFIADLSLSANWMVSLAPYNDNTLGADPYYYREDTGVPIENYTEHVFEVRIGVQEDGQPRTQWLIDGEVVGSYIGFLDPNDGGGLASARDGLFGVTHAFTPGFGAYRRNADGATLAWLAIRYAQVIRNTEFA